MKEGVIESRRKYDEMEAADMVIDFYGDGPIFREPWDLDELKKGASEKRPIIIAYVTRASTRTPPKKYVRVVVGRLKRVRKKQRGPDFDWSMYAHLVFKAIDKEQGDYGEMHSLEKEQQPSSSSYKEGYSPADIREVFQYDIEILKEILESYLGYDEKCWQYALETLNSCSGVLFEE